MELLFSFTGQQDSLQKHSSSYYNETRAQVSSLATTPFEIQKRVAHTPTQLIHQMNGWINPPTILQIISDYSMK